MSAFNEKFARWKTALKDAAVGPLKVAEEVVAGYDTWDDKETGRQYSSALENVLGDGKNFRFFQMRAEAVRLIGGMRKAHIFAHGAAVWLTGKAQDDVLQRCIAECGAAYNENRKCPLTTAQVVRVCRDTLGLPKRTRVAICTLCLEKEREIERLQAELEAAEKHESKGEKSANLE